MYIDLGNSQAGPCGEPTGHPEHARPPIIPAGEEEARIQDNQPKNRALQRVHLQGAPSSTRQSLEEHACTPTGKSCMSQGKRLSLLVPVSHQLRGANRSGY